jgi:enamine deaminase RidA (YjgF/YER057c/UK114 family)
MPWTEGDPAHAAPISGDLNVTPRLPSLPWSWKIAIVRVRVEVRERMDTLRVESKLEELGLELPSAPAPIANYLRYVQVGNLLFMAGHGPNRAGGPVYTGQVGSDVSAETAYEAARSTALNLLASCKEALGDLDRVKRVVKVLGMVNSAPGFGDQPKVINGFSDLMVELYGDAGRHARSAVGMAALPGGIPVEIEMILEVE